MKDLLISDHQELDALLEKLFAAFDKGDAAQVYEKLDFFWARLAMHIRAENLHLFPLILKAARAQAEKENNESFPSLEFVRSSIQMLENDHNFFMRELGDAIKQMFEMRENNWQTAPENLSALREKIVAVRNRLEVHNELEETYVYLWAEIFNPTEVPSLQTKIQRELENLPPRFSKPATQD